MRESSIADSSTEISQAVGVGFIVMGVIGYIVKLVHIPVNNILVGGS
jgi:protein transport protein SEC61 subunit gamma-like protein